MKWSGLTQRKSARNRAILAISAQIRIISSHQRREVVDDLRSRAFTPVELGPSRGRV